MTEVDVADTNAGVAPWLGTERSAVVEAVTVFETAAEPAELDANTWKSKGEETGSPVSLIDVTLSVVANCVNEPLPLGLDSQ